jgi:hypothetical protein
MYSHIFFFLICHRSSSRVAFSAHFFLRSKVHLLLLEAHCGPKGLGFANWGQKLGKSANKRFQGIKMEEGGYLQVLKGLKLQTLTLLLPVPYYLNTWYITKTAMTALVIVTWRWWWGTERPDCGTRWPGPRRPCGPRPAGRPPRQTDRRAPGHTSAQHLDHH